MPPIQVRETARRVLPWMFAGALLSLLLAFGQGFHHQLLKDAAGLGTRIVIAWPSRTSIPHEGLGKGRQIVLTERDIALLRARARVSPELSRTPVLSSRTFNGLCGGSAERPH